MRPADFSDEAIIAVGEELERAGVQITGWALHKALGGGKSSRLLQVWQARTSKVAPAAAPLPPAVSDEVTAATAAIVERVQRLVSLVHGQATEVGNHRIAEIELAAQRRCEQAERDTNEASATIDQLQAMLEARDHPSSTLFAQSLSNSGGGSLRIKDLEQRFG